MFPLNKIGKYSQAAMASAVSVNCIRNQSSNLSPRLTGMPVNNCELYPRLRRTEIYYESQPPEAYQVRSFEHNNDAPHHSKRFRRERITPPKNSAMRVMRDSYFS